MKKSLYFIQMFAVTAIFILLSLFFKRSFWLIVDYISFSLMILFIIVPTVFVYGVKNALSNFKVAFEKKSEIKQKKRAIRYFKDMTNYTILASITISLASILFMLGNLDIPSTTIGRFLATALITPLYSIAFSLILFFPLKVTLENSLE